MARDGGVGALLGSRAAPVALFIFIVCCWLAFSQALFNDGDTSWHLAAGQWILNHRAIPSADPFSFTFRGHPWTAHEWLAEIIAAGAYRLAGWAAVALVYTLCLGVTLLIIARQLLRWLPVRHVVAALAVLMLVIAPFVLARPHMMAWPLLAGWIVILMRARKEARAPPLYWTPLMLVWANLHASYIFGLALAGLFALEALIAERDKVRVVIGWGGFGIASLLLAFATPHGVQGFLYPFQVSGMAALPLIQEWRATELPKDWAFALFALAVLAAAVLRWRRIPTVRVVLVAGLAGLAIAHVRHQALFAIVSMLLVAPAVSPGREDERSIADTQKIWRLLAIGLAVLGVARILIPLQRVDGATYPGAAIAHVPAALRSQPVLNSYSFGGPLILNGIAPFIDGRADMYGDAFTFRHQAIVDGSAAALEQVRRRWGIKWTILAPETPLIVSLDRDPRWHRIYADRWAVVHAFSPSK